MQEYTTGSFIGFELISQDNESCIIKSLSTEKEEEFEIILKRVFQGILQMDELFYNFLRKKNNSIDLILNLEKINNRQTMYLQRIISKGKVGGEFLYAMSIFLEKLANEYKFIIHNNLNILNI